MTREEAIRILASSCISGSKQTEALETLIPELRESEDERIRKYFIWIVKNVLNNIQGLKLSEEQTIELIDNYSGIKESDMIAWLEKQKEQKPAESISQLTVQGKGVYKICPRCKERMVRDDSMVYTSMPPQYRYECPKCGESECDTFMYDNPETDEQKPAENGVDVIKTSALLAADRLASAEMTGRLKERSEILDNPTKYGLQKPAEWSEEDEACIRNLESIIYYDKKLPNDTRVILGKFLSNLRSKSHWKPSEEQMAALNVLNLHGDLSYVGQQNQLISLYNDLKKLM